MSDLSISYQHVDRLTPYSNNPRTHSKKQLAQLASSIEEFGFTNPILVDDTGGVIAGHGRLEAAKMMGIDKVPTVLLADMSEAQKKAYIIADNRLAENAGWDENILAIELQGLIDVGFDVELTGFDIPEIDILLSEPDGNTLSEDDEFDSPDASTPAVTQPGDLWLLGNHRLLCADATDPASYQRLLGDEKAQMVFTDPPYNVPIDKHVCGNGQIKHREFAMASGEMSPAHFTAFLQTVFEALAGHSKSGSIHYICMDWRHIGELLSAAESVYTELKNLCVWNKDNGGMGSLYRSKHELVFVFKHGKRQHINNVELGRHGRYRTNVWDYPGANSFHTKQEDSLALHPTVKPVTLVADAILDCSRPKGLILDPFGGSGTTLLAAEKTQRVAALMELDPHYCDVILRRFEDLTGISVRLEATGQNFAEKEQEILKTLEVAS